MAYSWALDSWVRQPQNAVFLSSLDSSDEGDQAGSWSQEGKPHSRSGGALHLG